MIVKENWTDIDFLEMSWHDSYIYSMIFPGEKLIVSFDIDYLFEWVLVKKENLYNFWISPCILIFYDVLNLKVNLDFKNGVKLQIDAIKRINQRLSPNGNVLVWDYIIETDKGTISFESTGFLQKVEKQPVLKSSQELSRE